MSPPSFRRFCLEFFGTWLLAITAAWLWVKAHEWVLAALGNP